MIVQVHFVGNQFVAYDTDGNRITDRNILQQLEFELFTGTKRIINVEVDNSTNDDVKQNIESTIITGIVDALYFYK